MASVDPRDLLAHSAWLRQLARSLAREDAEDLVQETWLATVRSPPSGERGVRAWLRTVITNAARLRRRGDANRAARERVVAADADDTSPTSHDLLERHEIQQLVARLVGELDEPFRSTILLRFSEGLTPTEIARQLGVPAGTVRWRLKEALARLRKQLDEVHGGQRRVWMIMLAPFAVPRPAKTSTLGIAIVFATVLAVMVMLAFAVSPRVFVPGGNGTRSIAERATESEPAGDTARSDMRTADAFAQEGATMRRLRGRVTMDGIAAAGVAVSLLAAPLPVRQVLTDADGRFDFGELVAREYVVGASARSRLGAIMRVDLRDPNAPADLELVLDRCSASLYGRVTDAAGTPIEGALVTREGLVGVETTSNGNYDLCVLPTAALAAELRLVVRAEGFGTIVDAIAAPGRMRHDFIMAPEAAVTGRVVGPDGAGIAHARVSLDLTGILPPASPERGFALSTVSDESGSFRIDGLATGEYQIVAQTSDATGTPLRFSVEATEVRTLDLRIAPAGIVRGRIICHGEPVGGVVVSVSGESAVSQVDGSFVLAPVPVGDSVLETHPYQTVSGALHVVAGDNNRVELAVERLAAIYGTVRRHGAPVPFARVGITGPSAAGLTADASGHYEAAGLEPGTYSFFSDDRRRGAMFAEDRSVELGPAESQEHDIELAWGAVITGRVVNMRGEPVDGAAVNLRGPMQSQCVADASGAFTCGALRAGTYTVRVDASIGGATSFPTVGARAVVELHGDDARVDGVLLVLDTTTSTLAGTVSGPGGEPLPDLIVRAVALELTDQRSFQPDLAGMTDEHGRFRIPGVSPGTYCVETTNRDLGARQVAQAGTTNISLVLDRTTCDAARGQAPTTLTRSESAIIWNEEIQLVGWSLPTTATRGTPVEVVLAYRSLRAVASDWRAFVHFDSAIARVNGDHDPARGWCPTSTWKPGETVIDRFWIRFDEVGRYGLTAGWFRGDAPNWQNLPLSVAPANMTNDTRTGVRLGAIDVN